MGNRVPRLHVSSEAKFGCCGTDAGQFKNPSHVTVSTKTGNIVVADTKNNRIQVFDASGQFVSMFGTKGECDGQFRFRSYNVFDMNNTAGGVAVTADGHIAVCDTQNHRLQIFTEQGQHLGTIGSKGTTPGRFKSPHGIACSEELLYVCDTDNSRVQVLMLDGTVVKVIKSRFLHPFEVAVRADQTVAVTGRSCIQLFRPDGSKKSVNWPADQEMSSCCVTVDDEGRFVATANTNEIAFLDDSGKQIGSLRANSPRGVAYTRDGRLVVVETLKDRIRIIRYE